MSTIADYSVFTKAFLATSEVDFSQLYTQEEGSRKAFAVVPMNLDPPLTTQGALNFDSSNWNYGDIKGHISCRDAEGNFIGNIVRIQPGVRGGSIRLVAKVAALKALEDNSAASPYNTFVLLRASSSTNEYLPIAVATISEGYTLHRHVAEGTDPLDDVENASYVSFTINRLNGYTSVDFNPDAYATYDVTDALSHRVDVLEGKEGIEGLHLAFNSNTGDIILSDSEGNVIDQANLHLDRSTDTIIAEGEEGYKYVKTDINQNVHSAKAFMAPPYKDGSCPSAFGSSDAVTYNTQSASLVRYVSSSSEESPSKACNGIRVRWNGQDQTSHDEIFYVCLVEGDGNNGTETGKKYLAWNRYTISDSELTQDDPVLFRKASDNPIDDNPIEVTGDSSIYSGNPDFSGIAPVYNHDVFVHTVGNSSLADWDECFKLVGFHDGDDIPLGTDLPELMPSISSSKSNPEEFIHGVTFQNKEHVETQRELAKYEMRAYNSRRPTLTEDREHGTIIDSSGLDVRRGSITLGCGRVGEEDKFQKINYGIRMRQRFGYEDDPNTYESLDFTISHHTGKVQFDENGHAAQTGDNEVLVPLTSSTLLSIEAGSYISGAPTCLILAEVTSKDGSPVFTPVRMTAGFNVESTYDTSSGLSLTIHDYRDNIKAVLPDPKSNSNAATSIIEVQAIYTHHGALDETVPAQQMHTYIGSWDYEQNPPSCSFLCNKIEEWMTAVGLTDTAESVKLYVVIRVY